MDQQGSPHGSSSRDDWQALAVQVVKSCGYGALLILGVQDPQPICEFLFHGVDVTGLTAAPEPLGRIEAVVPGRVRAANADAALDLDESERFETVIFLADEGVTNIWSADEDLPRRLVRSGRSVLIVLLGAIDSPEARSDWTARFLRAGARVHPLSHEVVPVDGVMPLGRALLLFERIPLAGEKGPAQHRFKPIASDLGAEAESRRARYTIAARFVRPSDHVLDSVSGSGEGAYVLSRVTAASIVGWTATLQEKLQARRLFTSATDNNLTFVPAPDNRLKGVASGSFDFIVACDDSDQFDSWRYESRRALTPGGRLFACQRVAESAAVDVAQALVSELESNGLLLERSWLQHAQRSRGDGTLENQFDEVTPKAMRPSKGDWIVLLLMRSVADRASVRTQAMGDDRGPNVVAFARDYENPWVVRGLVSMGHRATSAGLREVMAEEILVSAPIDSADRGAALCVLCYGDLERGVSAEVLRGRQSLALNFAEISSANPSVLRWQISLLFVTGLMAQKMGDLISARSIFARVRDRDALTFSPLLGTKTVGAALRSGVIAFAGGDYEGARGEWTRALSETRRLLRDGDWKEILVDTERPETFGLPEVAAFVMDGARAAGGLRALRDFPHKPALVWQALHCTQDDMLKAQDLELRSLRRWHNDHDLRREAWITELDKGKLWLEQKLSSWQSVASEQEEHIQTLASELRRLDEVRGWLEQQLVSWQSAVRERDEQLKAFATQVIGLDEGRSWLEQQMVSWQLVVSDREEQLRALTTQMTRLDEGRSWLEAQLLSWQSVASEREEQLRALTTQMMRLDEGRSWLEAQLLSWQSVASEREEQIRALTTQITQLDEGRSWLEARLLSWQSLASDREEQLKTLTAQVTQLYDGRSSLEQQCASWQAASEELDCQLRESASQSRRLRDTIELVLREKLEQSVQLELKDQRILALQAELHVIARVSVEESRRLKSIESSYWVKLGRKLGLIRTRK